MTLKCEWIKKIQEQAKRTRLCKFKNLHCPKILLNLKKANKKAYDFGIWQVATENVEKCTI
jgi:hypothetical protein